MYTRQEIFDKVSAHLLTQKARSESFSTNGVGYDGCAYRGEAGMKCAIGCLIPDNLYDPIIEGETPESVTIIDSLDSVFYASRNKLKEIFTQLDLMDHLDFLRELQTVHDTAEPCDWKDRLLGVAEKYKLKFNPPNA